MRGWKPTARRSPASRAGGDGVPAAGAVGGAERLERRAGRALSGSMASWPASASASARTSGAETNGMSQATQTTGAGASTTAV